MVIVQCFRSNVQMKDVRRLYQEIRCLSNLSFSILYFHSKVLNNLFHNFQFHFQMDEHQKMKCLYEEISCPFNKAGCDFKVCSFKTTFCQS